MSPKRSSFFLLVLSLMLVLFSCAAPEPLSFSLSIEVTPDNSGTIVEGEGENYIVGSDVNVKVEPKTGYDFVNWTNANGDVISEAMEFTYTMPEKNVVLTANFEEAVRTVTFDGNGGTPESQTLEVNYGDSVDSLPDVSRDGYVNVDWNTKQDGSGDSFTIDTPVNEDITVYAIWVEEKTITFDGNGGAPETQNLNVAKGETIDSLPDVSRIGYLLKEWNTSIDGTGDVFDTSTIVNEDITVYAIWVEEMTITFDGNGGTPETQYLNVAKGDTVDSLPVVENTGHTFKEWNVAQDGSGDVFDNTTVVNEDLTVYAIWDINSYEVATSVSPENSGEITETATYVYNSTVTLTATPNETYSFVNWILPEGVSLDSGYTVEDSKIEFTMIAEDINVEAIFEGEFTGGDGSSNDPYLISTVNNLNNVRNYLDANYKLTSDIDLNSVENWEPIGDDTNPFSGSFDGGDYTISNMTIESDKTHIGFFGYISENASVTNITLDNIIINGSTQNYGNSIGGLIGTNLGHVSNSNTQVTMEDVAGRIGGLIGINKGLIENTSSDASITSRVYPPFVGGLVGKNESIPHTLDTGVIKNSHSSGYISTDSQSGGFVFRNRGRIENSSSSVDFKGYSADRVGGFVGINQGDITKSYASGDIIGDESVGGFVGENQTDGKIEQSFSLGSVLGDYHTGGFVGMNEGRINNTYTYSDVEGDVSFGGFAGGTEDTSEIKESYVINNINLNDGVVFSKSGAGTYKKNYFYADYYEEPSESRAEGLTAEQMVKEDSYSFWNFSTIWAIDEGNSYPYFTWQEETSHNYPE